MPVIWCHWSWCQVNWNEKKEKSYLKSKLTRESSVFRPNQVETRKWWRIFQTEPARNSWLKLNIPESSNLTLDLVLSPGVKQKYRSYRWCSQVGYRMTRWRIETDKQTLKDAQKLISCKRCTPLFLWNTCKSKWKRKSKETLKKIFRISQFYVFSKWS